MLFCLVFVRGRRRIRRRRRRRAINPRHPGPGTFATLRTFPKIEKVFRVVKRISNLDIKEKKCVLIPLGEPYSDILVRKVRAFLAINVPSWATFEVASACEYLGFWIGPKISEKIWQKAERKWCSRSQAIADAKLAPSLGIRMYNTRAVTTLGYMAQLHPLPQSMVKEEKSSVQHIFHVLSNTYPCVMVFKLAEIGMPQPHSLGFVSFASKFGAAIKTITVWRDNLTRLNIAWSDFAPIWVVRWRCSLESLAGHAAQR